MLAGFKRYMKGSMQKGPLWHSLSPLVEKINIAQFWYILALQNILGGYFLRGAFHMSCLYRAI